MNATLKEGEEWAGQIILSSSALRPAPLCGVLLSLQLGDI